MVRIPRQVDCTEKVHIVPTYHQFLKSLSPFYYQIAEMLIVVVFIVTHPLRCLRGDWAGMDDPSVYNCSVAVAEARAAKYVISYYTTAK